MCSSDLQGMQAVEKQETEEQLKQKSFEMQMDSPIMKEIEATARAYMSNPGSVKRQFLAKQEITTKAAPLPECAKTKTVESREKEREKGPFSFSHGDDPTNDLGDEL